MILLLFLITPPPPVFVTRAKSVEKTDRHLNPLKVLHCVDELMAEDSIIVADGGDFVGSAAYIMRPRGPLRWLDPGKSPTGLSSGTTALIKANWNREELFPGALKTF